MSLLMLLFLIPFAAAVLAFFLPLGRQLKVFAFIFSLFPLAMLIFGNEGWIGQTVNHMWFPQISIYFHLHVDALSLLFLFLTAIVIPIAILATNDASLERPHAFYALIFGLEGLLFGFFTARDLALFTVFWEAMLLPLYFLISFWGGETRQKTALKFLVYMVAGSALMIAAVLALYLASFTIVQGGTFNLDVLQKVAHTAPHAAWICAIFLLAFSVKTPLFPFHAWLPDTYCEAPVGGTILLSAILSKAGVYGIVRIGIELFPSLMEAWEPLLLGLAIAGTLYAALAAWRQSDYKRLIAYSSLSHVNFVLAGLFVWDLTAHTGAILQAFNHGITIAGLFLVAGWLEERIGSTSIERATGLAKNLTRLCWLTLFFVLSSVALPGLNNFIGELLVLFGLFKQNPWLAFILGLTVIFSVIYMLRWMEKMYFGKPNSIPGKDIGWCQLAIASPLVALILWVGIYPTPLLRLIQSFWS